jgi:hypothetical protein
MAFRWGLLTLLLLLGSGQAQAQITNDDCTGAINVPVQANCSMPLNGTVQSATQSLAPTANCGFGITAANDVWYSFVATGATQLITLAPRFQAILDVRSGSCAASASVFCGQVFTGNTTPTPVGGLTSGLTYFIRVYASGPVPPAGISSTFALCVSPGSSTSTPPNDDCAGAIDVPVQAGGVCVNQTAGDNTGASNSIGVPAPTCANYQGGDIWFKVTVPASGTVTVRTVTPTTGSPVTDTGLSIYAGACGSLTEVGCDDDSGGLGGQSLITVSGRTPGEILLIRAWDYGGGQFGAIALCAVTFSTPGNDNCAQAVAVPVTTTCATPVNGTVGAASQSLPPSANCGIATAANDVWYSFVANGPTQTVTLNANFQTVIDVRSGSCAASASVFCSTGFGAQPRIIAGLTAGQTYFLRVYADGNIQPPPAAATFTLCITNGPVPPVNDECAQAIAVPVTTACATPVTGSVGNASQSLPPTANCGGAATADDVWYSFVASGPTQTITLTASFNAVLDVRSGTCANSTSIFCSNAFAGQGLTVGGLTSGQTYFLRIYPGFQPFNPSFTLCITPGPVPPANDDCAGAINVPVTATCAIPVLGTYAAAGQSLPATANCGLATTVRDVWYTFVATGATQTITVSGNLGAVVDVRSGTCAGSTSVFCATSFGGQSVIATGLTSGQAYYLRLYPNSNIQPTPVNGAFTLCIQAGPPPSPNDECTTAVPIAVVQSCVTSTNGTVASASQSLPPVAGCGAGVTTAADVWYSFVAAAPTQLITLTSRFGAVIDVRNGTCASSTSIFCNTVFANNATGTIVGGLTVGQTYYLRIYANGNIQPTPANATFTICINPAPTPPANDECAGAVSVPVTTACATPISGSVEAASQSLSPTANCGFGSTVAQDVWYRFVATGPTQLVTLTSRFGAALEVRSGTCASSTSVFCDAIFQNSTTATLVGGLTSGQTYYIRIYANGNQQPTPLNATFTLCINPGPTPPANDECTGAVVLPVTATCTPTSGTVAAASQSTPPTTGCGFGSNIANDVWYSFVATGVSHSITLTSPFPAVLDVRSGTCASSASSFCANVQGTAGSTQLVGGLTSGQTYFIRVYSAIAAQPTGTAAAFTICVTPAPTPPFNDDCAGAINVPVQFGNSCIAQTSVSNAAATGSNVPNPGCASYQGRDVWFQVTVPPSGTLTIRTVIPATGTDVGDTGLAVYSGACGSLSLIGCDDDAAGNLKSLIALNGRTAGEVLYIRVWDFGGNSLGNLAVCVTSPTTCGAPTAPATTNITSSTADLSWQPGGTPAPGTTYTVEYGQQGFFLGTGLALSGLTSPSLQLMSLLPSTAYCYYVRQDCPGTTGSSAYVGPICFTTTATCAVPSGLAAANITSTGAALSWLGGGMPAPGTTYTLIYGLQPLSPGNGTVLTGLSSPSLQLTSLQPGTAYCFYVRQNCPGGGSSALVGPQCFTTSGTPTCPAPSGLTSANATATTADVSWQPGGTPAPGTTYTVEYGLQGFTPGTGTLVLNIQGPGFTLSGLVPNSTLCYYVRQNCPGGGSSAYVGPSCFQTLPIIAVPVNDEPCGAIALTLTGIGAPAQPLTGANTNATTSTQAGIVLPACSPNTTPQDVWFTIVPAAGLTSVTLTLTGSVAGMVRVFTTPDCSTGPFVLVACQSSGANNTGLSTMNLPNLTPGQRYYITVSGYGANDTPGGFTLAGTNFVTGTRAQTETDALLVYPNPSNTGQLTLRLIGLSAVGEATLLNALGQSVLSAKVPRGSSEQVLKTHGLAAGVYTLRVVVGPDVLTRKVVLE